MKLRTPLSAFIGLTLAAGCDDGGSSTSSTATVTGRYVAESGASTSGQVEIVAVGDDGQTGLIASGDLFADGTFSLEVPPDAGPFIVQIRQIRQNQQVQTSGDAAISAQGLLPFALEAGERVTAELTTESSAEAAAYLAIISGEADSEDIDGVGLMAWIDARLAAEVDAARLGAAWMQYQAGFIAAANASGANLDASTMTSIGGELMKELSASAGDLESEIRFQRELATGLAAKVSYEAQVDARLAASALGSMALSGEGGAASEIAAEAGAELSAHAAWASQAQTATADVEARLNAAYEAFFEALAAGEAMAGAQAELAGSLGGDGQVALGSALALAASADGVSAADLRTAMNEASSQLSAQLEAAFAGASSARVDAVAEALVEARTDARQHFESRLGANATARLASELFVMTSHTENLLSIDLITATIGLALEGNLAAGIDASGVSAIVASTLSGELIAEGTASGSSFSLEGLTSADFEAPFIIAATDASGDWVAAIVVAGISGTAEATVTLTESMSAETTARARVAVELVMSGQADEDAVALVDLMSEAEAAIVLSTGDAVALAAAMEARAAFSAAAEDSNLDAELTAFVSSAFEVAAADMSSDNAWRFETLSRVEAALAIEAAAESELAASRFDAVRAEVSAAVEAFITAASEADVQAEAEAAWAAFVTQVDGTIDTTLGSALGVVADAQLAARLEAALAGAIDARADFEASLSAAFEGTSSELAAAASSVVSAASTWQSALSASLDLSFLVHLVAADQAAAAGFMGAAHIWLGR